MIALTIGISLHIAVELSIGYGVHHIHTLCVLWNMFKLHFMRKTKSIVVMGLACLVFASASGAESTMAGDSTLYGGIKQKVDMQTVMDSVLMDVSYSFIQQVVCEDGLSTTCDTMSLAIGQEHSLWFDPTFKGRLQAWFKSNMAQVRKASAPAVTEEPLETLLELSQLGSDHVNGFVGDPVQIYKDKNANELTSYLMHVARGPVVKCIQRSDSLFNWTIASDTATLCGYLCQKAMATYGGREYEAWFTPSIPISDGPWKLCGLPGLVLTAHDTDSCFVFQAIGLERTEDTYIMKDNTEFNPVDVEEFNKMAKKRKDEVPASFLHNGSVHYYNVSPQKYNTFER